MTVDGQHADGLREEEGRMTLSSLLAWFRHEWQAEMPQGRIHDRDTDDGGAPDWTDRFASFVGGIEKDDSRAPMSFPVRWHLSQMARASGRGRRRAEYLFRLACLGFDPLAAARASTNLADALDEHGEDFALDYAEACIRRLRDRMRDPELNDTDGKPRRFLPRKSESQHRAEEAA